MKKISILIFAFSLMHTGCISIDGSSSILTATPSITTDPTQTFTPTQMPTKTSTFTPTVSPTPSQTPNPYDAGNDMVLIPAGEFQMGCDPEKNGGLECKDDSLPLHPVFLDDFYIDKYEVTNAQFADCVTSGFCEESIYSDHLDEPLLANLPVVGIEFNNAEAYCSWVGKRLPTEAEWEKAARGTSPRAYPWGNEEPNCSLANVNCPCDPTVSEYYHGENCPDQVGSHPSGVSPYGVHDMAGNVFEWTSDYYSDSYYGWSPYNNPQGPTSEQASEFSYLACPTCTYLEHVLRGGSYRLLMYDGIDITSAYRFIQMQGPFENFGIRCAADADYDPSETPKKPASSCPGAPPQRLAIGEFGKVCTKSDSIRLRKTPGGDGEITGSLKPGTTFEVIGGPECAGSNWSWWKVRLDDGQEGWLAEGGDSIDPYFLCPIE